MNAAPQLELQPIADASTSARPWEIGRTCS